MRAGSQCALFPLVYQNDPRWGTEREKFIPERWLDADLSGKKEFAGFGLGKRNCIGMISFGSNLNNSFIIPTTRNN